MLAAPIPPTETWAPAGDEPPALMAVAVSSLKDVMETTLEMSLEVNGDPGGPDPDFAEVAGCIPMTTSQGGWNLAVSGKRDEVREVARAMLGMEETEEIEDELVSDALGEIANLVAGAMKTAVGTEGSSWRLGVPLYVEGSGWFLRAPTGSCFTAQRLTGGGRALQVVLCWRKG